DYYCAANYGSGSRQCIF
nr:immunoglobulin light chain junction region [Macaca mulatta]MOW17800.1 immunoglobulin light chain junction region [Macaca mulatta]